MVHISRSSLPAAEEVSHRIYSTLRANGVPLARVADTLGISPATVTERLKNKERTIDSIRFIQAVSKLTHVDPEELRPDLKDSNKVVSLDYSLFKVGKNHSEWMEALIHYFKVDKRELRRICDLSRTGLRDKIRNPRGIDSISFLITFSTLTPAPPMFFYNLFKG